VIRSCVGLLVALGLLAAPPVLAQTLSPEARVQLAPTGKLRVGFLLFEPALASRGAGGEPVGVAADLAHALADRAGVPLDPVVYESPLTYAESVGALKWDVAFAIREPRSAGRVDYGPAIMLIDHAFLLAPGKSFRDLADLDREKIRVGLTIGSVDELLLGDRLKKAIVFRVLIGTDNASLTLRSSGADVFAASVPFLDLVAPQVPGSRFMDRPFAVVPAVVAMAPGRIDAFTYVTEFVRQAKSSGLVQQAIGRAGLKGVRVAPP